MISPQISEQASAQQMADTIFLRPVVTSMIAQAEPGCADLLSRSGLLPSTQKSKANQDV